ncbi:MAG: 16S rRNA (cytidine(1402)-2'-O)-methyltransferase [Pyrinomonadaceae bacterium]|nr:16S rRNA (cytidine(1402)-2'-O)-methyltransferase [Pyrinomonadaceae bacterium]
MATGTLYLVSTPIGNLEDITHRALRVLSEVALIACEDTRHTRGLLNHFGIKTKTISYHEHNEHARAAELTELLVGGASVAIVSDAGTPGISDPGYRLIRACVEQRIVIVPVPGPSAFVAALAASGLPTDEFYFGGFLPARSTARRARLAQLRGLAATLIFYEAPHRIAGALADARDTLGEREAVVARELTKLHEEFARGRLSDLALKFSDAQAARGEMVLIIDRTTLSNEEAGDQSASVSLSARVAAIEAEGLDHRAALKRAARELGLSRDAAYRRLVAERAQQQSIAPESSGVTSNEEIDMNDQQQDRTFNEDQQQMFENANDAPSTTRQPTPGTQTVPPVASDTSVAGETPAAGDSAGKTATQVD